MSAWDYRGLPKQAWSWFVKTEPGLGCSVDKQATALPEGLSYTGDALHPNWGGGYTIGFQTWEEFLAKGGLDGLPEELAAQIRAHVLAHRVEVWDHGGVPRRSWTWSVDHDASLGCPAEKTVESLPTGLAYSGFALRPATGGAYTIGFQTYEEFLAGGGLAGLPEGIAAEIREHLAAHRAEAGPAELVLVARMAGAERTLKRVDASLDGQWVTANRPMVVEEGEGAGRVFFSGTVPAGSHVVSAAFVMEGPWPRIAYANGVLLSLASGERRRLTFTVDGKDVAVSR